MGKCPKFIVYKAVIKGQSPDRDSVRLIKGFAKKFDIQKSIIDLGSTEASVIKNRHHFVVVTYFSKAIYKKFKGFRDTVKNRVPERTEVNFPK